MRAEYDFSAGKRGALFQPKGKRRITIYLDEGVLSTFRKRAESAGTGYQTMINDALKSHFDIEAWDNAIRDMATEFEIYEIEIGCDGPPWMLKLLSNSVIAMDFLKENSSWQPRNRAILGLLIGDDTPVEAAGFLMGFEPAVVRAWVDWVKKCKPAETAPKWRVIPLTEQQSKKWKPEVSSI